VVEVPTKIQGQRHTVVEDGEENSSIYLDWLNEGSCFCIFTAFNKDLYQLVNFRASSTCIVESIKIKDLKRLEKSHIQLSDIFKQIEIEILNDEKTDLDFFRYRAPRTKAIPLNVKKIIRKKFRVAVINFCKQVKSGEKQQLPALDALKKF